MSYLADRIKEALTEYSRADDDDLASVQNALRSEKHAELLRLHWAAATLQRMLTEVLTEAER